LFSQASSQQRERRRFDLRNPATSPSFFPDPLPNACSVTPAAGEFLLLAFFLCVWFVAVD
jgi:SNF family Na+-dependent transporter